MKKIEPENFEKAMVCLFNSLKTEKYKEGDLALYARIGSFLTDEAAFKTAMRTVANEMETLLKLRTSEFEIAVNGGVYLRQVALGPDRGRAGYDAQAKADLEQSGGQASVTPTKIPKQVPKTFDLPGAQSRNEELAGKILAQRGLIEKREQEFIDTNPGFFKKDQGSGVVVRSFRFHRLLLEMEKTYDLKDKGMILMGDLDSAKFGDLLRGHEVWKDSIAAAHGEYTHRLQWLAVAIHFNLAKDDLLRLYAGSANAIRSKYKLYYTNTANAATTIATSLWNFLFDCFSQSHDAPTIWDGTVVNVTYGPDRRVPQLADDETQFLNALRASGRSDSFRSPANVTSMLRSDASMGLLHAYIACSQIKTPIKDNMIKGVSAYRKDRLTAKYGGDYKAIIQFVPPVSTSISASDIII